METPFHYLSIVTTRSLGQRSINSFTECTRFYRYDLYYVEICYIVRLNFLERDVREHTWTGVGTLCSVRRENVNLEPSLFLLRGVDYERKS